MMQRAGNEKLCVPPGFRFHPTEEELVYYYLRKKICYEPIDLDVIKEVDLNKLEPWDLKEKCRIGSGPQNEWYLFSHKDKKYPTGTRTNRATEAGFWKATGRDKAIHLMTNSKRIGMRKTLVFYTGRAPRGHKTDWIMHEYRFDDAEMNAQLIQEDGWVICRVFKKKNHNSRGFRSEIDQEEEQIIPDLHATVGFEPKRSPKQAEYNNFYTFDHHSNSMHLPQLLSPESTLSPSFLSSLPLISTIDTSQNNQIKLTSGVAGNSIGCGITLQQNSKFSGDWSFLDKLLTTHHTMDQINRSCQQFSQISELIPQYPRFSFSNNGYHETDFSKFNN